MELNASRPESPERVLLVHVLWHVRGGAERMTHGVRDLLEAHGHEVFPFGTRHPLDPPLPNQEFFPPYRDMVSVRLSPTGLAAAGGLLYSPRARWAVRALIERVEPDIAHVRTVAHHLSPSVLMELGKRDIPVLMHLPDFKPVCPSYKMLAGGQPCDRCLDRHFYHAIGQRCMKNSLSASALVALEAYLHRFMRVYENNVDLFVAPSRFLADALVAGGIPSDRVRVLHNFTDTGAWPYSEPSRMAEEPYVVAAGRLSFEKGLATLVRAAALVPEVRVVIAGDGPERDALEDLAHASCATNVTFPGRQEPEALRELFAGSRAVVVPSECHEVCSNTILEAMSTGRPAIGSRMGGSPELIVEGETGLLFDAGDVSALAEAMRTLAGDPDRAAQMGRAARLRAEARHSPEDYYAKLRALYAETRELHANGLSWRLG